MSSATWPVYSPFAREHYGRGRADGLKKGQADAILRVLAVREIEVSEEAGARIRACSDLRQLNVRLDRAAVATSVTDVFCQVPQS